MIIYKCDVCKKSVDEKDLLRFRINKKKSSTKLRDKSVGCKDVCYDCYNKVFGGKK